MERGLDYHSTLPPLVTTAKRGCKKNRKGYNLLVRLRDYQTCVLRCLIDVDIPFTNNQGEQDVRMNKVKQKISGCFRTQKGAENFANTRTVLCSGRKQKLSMLAVIRDPSLVSITVPPK